MYNNFSKEDGHFFPLNIIKNKLKKKTLVKQSIPRYKYQQKPRKLKWKAKVYTRE